MVADRAGAVRRILAIRPRALGDIVLTTPALRALAAGHPGARLEVVTYGRFAPLVACLPGVAEVLTMDRGTWTALLLIAEVRRRRYDLVVDFFGNPRTALLTQLSGAPVRAGYDLRARRVAYTVTVPREVRPADREREYAADVHVRLAAAVGGIADGASAAIVLPAAAIEKSEELLASAGIVNPERTIGLVPAGNWATKTLPLSHTVVIARRLAAAGWRILLLTGPGEEAIARAAVRLAPGLAVLPPCDVLALAATIRRLGAVVGTDSGPRHLAAALGIPTWAWFGPTHPDTWGPPGPEHGRTWTTLPCRGCDRTVCPHWNCLPGFDPDRLAVEIDQHLRKHVGHVAAVGSAARA